MDSSKGKDRFFSHTNHKDLCNDSTTVHYMLIFSPHLFLWPLLGIYKCMVSFHLLKVTAKSHSNMSCFWESGSPTTLHLKYFIYLILNPCLLGHPRRDRPMHLNGKLYPIGQPLIPTRYTAFNSDGLFSPTGSLIEVFWLTSIKFEFNRSQKIRGTWSAIPVCISVFDKKLKTVQANPGIVLTVGFVLESNWFYQATVKLSLQNQCSWKHGIRK